MHHEVTVGGGGPDGDELLGVAVHAPHARLPSDAAIVDPRPPRQAGQRRHAADRAEAAAVREKLDDLGVDALAVADGPSISVQVRAADPTDETDELLGVGVVADRGPPRAVEGRHTQRAQRRHRDAPAGRRARLRQLEMLQHRARLRLDHDQRVALVDEAQVARLDVHASALGTDDEDMLGRARRLACQHRGARARR